MADRLLQNNVEGNTPNKKNKVENKGYKNIGYPIYNRNTTFT